MDPKEPLHHRIRHHIVHTAGVCDAWCREARMYDRILPASFLVGVLLFLVYFVTLAAPLNFPSASLVHISEGANITEVAQLLKQKNIIRSALLFEGLERLRGGGAIVIAGEYFFPGPETVITVANRIASGDHELTPVRVTVPEGVTAVQISHLLAQDVPDFDSTGFLALAQPKEGTLFPDTYFFLPGEDVDLVLTTFENDFNEHIDAPTVAEAITTFGKPQSEVITMASILEKEAPDTKDREIISGILWKRISIGMALQVDSAFVYILGVDSLQLTTADLATSSPYNTYTHKGLPPGPISNPSLDSILAAVQPIQTDYLYYLSDLQGNIHYCATYACQLVNQRRYLGD